MKIIEVLKFNRELIKRLKTTGICLEDEAYVTCIQTILLYLVVVKRCLIVSEWISNCIKKVATLL